MRFQTDITIRRPIACVWDWFTDPTRLAEWQATLQAVEPVSGPQGEVGSVARLKYREAGRVVTMTETVVERNPPQLLASSLVSSMMSSTMRNEFTSLDDGTTRWEATCDIRFAGLWRLMELVGRRMIVRKTVHDMERFRDLLETRAESVTRDANRAEPKAAADRGA